MYPRGCEDARSNNNRAKRTRRQRGSQSEKAKPFTTSVGSRSWYSTQRAIEPSRASPLLHGVITHLPHSSVFMDKNVRLPFPIDLSSAVEGVYFSRGRTFRPQILREALKRVSIYIRPAPLNPSEIFPKMSYCLEQFENLGRG